MRPAWDDNEILPNWLVGYFVYLFLAVFSSQIIIHILHLYMLGLFAESKTKVLGGCQDYLVNK